MAQDNNPKSALPASILLVDDNAANLLALEALIAEPDRILVKVTSGEQAVDRASREEFAVILLDVFLPGLDGFQTAERIRQLPQCAHLPIIFVTAQEVSLEEFERGYQLGAVDFLIKPIASFILKAKVSGFVELYRQKLRARRESEQLRLLVDSTKDYAIFVLDVDGHVSSWNAGAERIKQYSPKEILGQHFSRFYTQKDIDRKWPDYEFSVARAEGRFEDEGWRVRKDGSQFWASVIITALFDESRQLRGFSKITRDMTERKQAEADLQNAYLELEKRVIERTEELARANNALRETDHRKDEFLATLAHELRNPLAPILNSLQILGLPQLDDGIARQTREVIERQVQHLIRLVDDLLDISRVMKGKIKLRKERVPLKAIVARAIEMVRPMVDAHHHEIVLDLPDENLLVDADPVRLTQILGNMLANSAKYTEPNGRIAITARSENGDVVCEIQDNGIGIDAKLLPHIFGLFVQADHATTKSQGGLGIGLTLVKSLAEMHRGSVAAFSDGLGTGSRFVFRMPLTSIPNDVTDEQSTSEPVKGTSDGLRILIVDDNKDAADSLSMLLRFLGHDVSTAYEGASAMKIAESFHPAAIFLDIGMPITDGYEVARQMRRLPGLENVFLIALTGWGQQDVRRRTSEAGFNHHLVKPLEPKLLKSLLQSLTQIRSDATK